MGDRVNTPNRKNCKEENSGRYKFILLYHMFHFIYNILNRCFIDSELVFISITLTTIYRFGSNVNTNKEV